MKLFPYVQFYLAFKLDGKVLKLEKIILFTLAIRKTLNKKLADHQFEYHQPTKVHPLQIQSQSNEKYTVYKNYRRLITINRENGSLCKLLISSNQLFFFLLFTYFDITKLSFLGNSGASYQRIVK
jgi:hypothetical protein